MVMAILVVIGMFWLVIAVIGLLGAVHYSDGVLAAVGGWNLVWGGAILYEIRAVVRRSRRAVSDLLIVSVFGSIWGLVSGFFLGGWFQSFAVPLHIVLGILVAVSRDHFPRGGKTAKARPFGLTHS